MNSTQERLGRRDFLKTVGAAGAGLALQPLVLPGSLAYAGGADTLRVGLVGCGGRGSGAANDCVQSSPGVEIYALGDLYPDRLAAARANLAAEIGDRLNAPEERCFYGFDAYRHVMNAGVHAVILATPPGFRPAHLEAAVEAGLHVFTEKPVAVDAAGVRRALAAGEAARRKNLSVVAGTQYRRQPSFVEAVRRIHDGMIGEVVGAQAYYLTGPIWLRDRKPGMSDMEWQTRNWYYFTWLSGDHIVEQFVHNLDTLNWALGANPVSALGMGARFVRTDPSFGHIYDQFSVEYAYPNEVRVEAKCRQMEGVARRVTNRIIGTQGIADIHTDRSVLRSHRGAVLYEHPERGNNPYVQEHADWVASIRAGAPLNEVESVAHSTLVGILGRESAYTGQELRWDDVLASAQDLTPGPMVFGPLPMPEPPIPGVTTLDRSRPAGARALSS